MKAKSNKRAESIKKQIKSLTVEQRKSHGAMVAAGRKYDSFDRAESQIEKAQDKAERLLARQFAAKLQANSRAQRKAEAVLDRTETMTDRIASRINLLKAVLKELSR